MAHHLQKVIILSLALGMAAASAAAPPKRPFSHKFHMTQVPQCESCHTVDGYLSIRQIVEAPDADTLGLILEVLRDQGQGYVSGQHTERGHVATQKLDYPAMPPLVGTTQEIDALKAYLVSLKAPQTVEVSHAR